MVQAAVIVLRMQIAIFVLLILLSLVYLLPILLVRRFHNVNNVFTVNLCIAAICCGLYWLLNLVLSQYYPHVQLSREVCTALNYFEMMCTIQVPFAMAEVSVHRLCCVVYHTKAFFRRKEWIILCIVSQWASGIIVPVPRLLFMDSNCHDPHWMGIYAFLVAVIIPSLICLIINIIIFSYVRSSTTRVSSSPATTTAKSPHRINRRDLRLLRHMIVMLCIFVGGWAPTYLYSFIATATTNNIVFPILMVLAELSTTIDIINLFLYNHELRRYLIAKVFPCE